MDGDSEAQDRVEWRIVGDGFVLRTQADAESAADSDEKNAWKLPSYKIIGSQINYLFTEPL